MDLGAAQFTLNHMVAPRLPLPAFFALATEMDIASVEIFEPAAMKDLRRLSLSPLACIGWMPRISAAAWRKA